MKNLTFFILSLLYFHGLLFSQVSVTRDGSEPDGTAMMDVKSEQSGFLPPRMNKVQRDAIAAPQDGLMVFCTDCNYNNSGALSVFYQGHWRSGPLAPSASLLPDSRLPHGRRPYHNCHANHLELDYSPRSPWL